MTSVTEITSLDKSRYNRLTAGLRRADPTQHALETLCDMKCVEITDSENCSMPINQMCRWGDEKFKCLCGKSNIHKLAVVEHKGHNYLFGSSCVSELERMAMMAEYDPNLREKVSEWVASFKAFEKERTKKKQAEVNKPCAGCGECVVRPDYKYKDKRRRIRGKCCVKGKQVFCGKCEKWVYHPKGSPKNLYYHQCEKCYAKEKNLEYELPKGSCLVFLSDSE